MSAGQGTRCGGHESWAWPWRRTRPWRWQQADGEQVAIGGWQPDRNPVIQARAQAGWLRALLKETTGRDFPILPVIVYPGWFVKQDGRPKTPLWVLNPKALPQFLKNRETTLGQSDIKLAAYHLSRFIRAHEREQAKK